MDKKTCVIACEVFRDELTKALEETGADYPVVWLEMGLHDQPGVLHNWLQNAVSEAEAEGYERILLCYGLCGNAIEGVQGGRAELIAHRADDCISVFVGAAGERSAVKDSTAAFYMTRGWSKEKSMDDALDSLIEEYDEEEGREIFDMMYGHYKTIVVVDTGCFPLAEVQEKAEKTAKRLGLTCQTVKGSMERVKRLLTGPWDERDFMRIPPKTF